MYNATPPDQIPPFLPIAVTVLLKKWFDTDILDKGMNLLKKGKLSHFFIYRNSAAGILDKSALYILFAQTNRISEGFTLQEEHCELCGFNRKGKRCEHLAALCILSLYAREDRSYYPLPLLFKQSAWLKTADFLHSWLSKENGATTISGNEQAIRVQKKTTTGSIEAVLSNRCTVSAALLKNECDESVHAIFAKMQQRCSTKNEQLLVEAGAVSKGLQQDGSIWTRLCAQMFCCLGDISPEITYSSTSGCFQLQAGDEQSAIHLTAVLPRAKTYSLLRSLNKLDGPFRPLPDGRSGSSVTLDTEGNIVISPLARLADGRVMRFAELQRHKYGNHYYLHGEGFLQLQSADKDARIAAGNTTSRPPSLFDYLRKDDQQIIKHNDIADFLERNKTQLQHPDNEVAPEVLDIRFIHIPDRLIISELQEEDGWIVLNCQFGIAGDVVPLPQFMQKLAKKTPIITGHTTLTLHEGPLTWLYKLFARNNSSTNDTPITAIRLTRGEFACLVGAIPVIEHQHKDRRLQHTLARLTAPDNQNSRNTAIRYQHHLRDYQKDGLSWLFTLFELGFGGILADDMGLGKTHQALALIETVIGETSTTAPILIICPASVLLHWADKLDRFYPELRYALYYGPGRNLATALQQRLVITTYAIARGDRDVLAEHPFELIVFDEIQAIKNRKTATHQACRAFRTRVAIGLSGTPIENSLEDLYAIFAVCLPGFFGPFKSFGDNFIAPIEKGGASRQEQLLSQRIHPFILRRSRRQVLVELPELIDDDRTCELSEKQLQLYRETISAQQPLLNSIADEGTQVDYLHVFAMLTRLKQICNHPCLLEKCPNPEKYRSGKWDLFIELLHESLENGRKVVVFSQYLGMLDLMAHHLSAMRIGFAELRGAMNVGKRQAMIDQFTRDDNCRVFTASLLAGGVGIDLMAGSVVIHYDRWWNPAKEEQATARVHRMGQKDVVQLFRLSTKNTVEEKINAIIAGKKTLSDKIIKEDELGMIKQLSREQLLELFSM